MYTQKKKFRQSCKLHCNQPGREVFLKDENREVGIWHPCVVINIKGESKNQRHKRCNLVDSIIILLFWGTHKERKSLKQDHSIAKMRMTCMEAKHEEANVLDEHSDQAKEKARRHCYQGVAPLCWIFLLKVWFSWFISQPGKTSSSAQMR